MKIMKPAIPSAPSTNWPAFVLAMFLCGGGIVVRADTNCFSPPSGLISWWRAEGNASDQVGGNTGTLIGNAGYGAGRVGQAFAFDGSSDAVRLGNPANLNLQDLTIEGWIKRASASVVSYGQEGKGVVFSHGNGGYVFHLEADGALAFGKGWVSGITASAAVTDTNHHHVAVTKSGSTVTFYVDGVAYGAPAYDPGFVTTANAAIGGHDDLGNSLLGNIDEIAVYNRGLSASEIQGLYLAGAGGKCTGPSPPSVLLQPTNQTVLIGEGAVFRVVGGGSEPLSYQWRLNGTNISGATTTSLLLTNAQLADAGDYTAVISNALDSVITSNAVLAVNPPPPCLTPPTGLVSWWRAEGNASDQVGGNTGTPVGNAGYGVGRVGQAFAFDGNGDAVRLGNPANLDLQNLTIEGWIKRASASVVSYGQEGKGVVFSHGNGGYVFHLEANGALAFGKGWVSGITTSAAVTDTNHHHVAVTKSGSTVTFYVDGMAYGAPAYDPGFVATANAAIGGHDDLGNSLLGNIDEIAVYNRALTTNEIQAIYNASASGKCVVDIPPFISAQPAGKTVTVGSNATFTVSASGSVPLSYQWRLNGTNIAGATGSGLTLTNVQMSQAGNYSVVVTNVAGATNSSDALLTVVFPPATFRVVGGNAASGGPVTLPVQLVANGNENALGFSLNFSTQRLSYAGVTLGSGASGASMLLNTSQTGSGRIGIALALPANGTFAAGTQEVAQVNLNSYVVQGGSPVSTTLTFGDVPTSRQLSTPQAQPLPASYITGFLSLLPSDLEGDTVPRPAGDRTNSITDWVQVGRFAARLDGAADGGEFQRADCAPRSSLGNGHINVTDWVQAGRYAAGLDPLTAVGGPTSEGGPAAASAGRPVQGAAREVRVGNASGVQGVSVTLPVLLESQGDENALGFSVSFDAAKFSYAGASLGSAAAGASFNVNAGQVAAGKLGLAIGLPLDTTFPAGLREVAKVALIPTAAAVGSNPVALSDDPVSRAISSALANELAAGYVAGSVSVNPLPSLLITRSGDDVTLTWPVWAADFALQSADGGITGGWANVNAPSQTNGGNLVVTLPITSDTKFFRLQHP